MSVITQQLREGMAPFKDEWGLFSLAKNPVKNANNIGDGNLLLYSALYYSALGAAGEITQQDANDWQESLRLCKRVGYHMYWRAPCKNNPDDTQQHDDYWGINGANFHTNAGHISLGIYQHGKTHRWCFNIQEPDKFVWNYWFYRFVDFIPFTKLCGGLNPAWLQWRILYAQSWLARHFISHSGARVRRYIILSVLAKRSAKGKALAQAWAKKMRQKFGTIGGAFRGEIPDGNPLLTIDWI